MLAALAEVLRFDLILTTNFDSLIEHAFDQAEQRYRAIDVTIGNSLPPVVEEAGVIPIVKLHGSRLGLRADYSLDAPVEEKDLKRFVSYLVNAGTQLEYRERNLGAHLADEAVALLVMGVSASDRRMTEFIADAVRTLKNFRIFWIYHSTTDEKQLRNTFLCHPEVAKADTDNKIKRVKASDLGRALLEVYQSCTSSIPASGVSLPVAWNLPMPPIIPEMQKDVDAKIPLLAAGRFEEKLKEAIKATSDKDFAVIDFNSVKSVLGVQTVASKVFRDRDWDNSANSCKLLWLELDDFADLSELFLKMLISIATAMGHKRHVPTLYLKWFTAKMPKRPSTVFSSGYKHDLDLLALEFAQQIQALTPHPDNRWIVFINALEPLNHGYGQKRDEVVRRNQEKAFWYVLNCLASGRYNNQRMAGVVRGSSEQSASKRHLLNKRGAITFVLLRNENELTFASDVKLRSGKYVPVRMAKASTRFNREEAVKNAVKWADEELKKWIFLKLLGAFKLVRHKAGMLKTTRRMFVKLQIQPMEFGHIEMDDWLTQLNLKDIIRFKEGGFVWTSVYVREELEARANQKLLDLLSLPRIEDAGASKFKLPLPSALSSLLQADISIAQWYERLFFCSGDPLAVLIAIEHYLRGILGGPLSSESEGKKTEPNVESPLIGIRAKRSASSDYPWKEALDGVSHSIVLAQNARSLVERRISEPLTVRHVDRLIEFIDKIVNISKNRRKFDVEQDKINWFSALQSLRDVLTDIKLRVTRIEGNIEEFSNTLYRALRGKSIPAGRNVELNFEKAKAALFSRRISDAIEILERLDKSGCPPPPEERERPIAKKPPSSKAPIKGDSQDYIRTAAICRWLSYSTLIGAQIKYLAGGRSREKNLKEREIERQSYLRACIGDCRDALDTLRSNQINNLKSGQRESARTRIQLGYIYAILGHSHSNLGGADTRTQDDGYPSLATQALSAAESFLQDFPLHDDLLARGALELRKSELSLIRVTADLRFGVLRQGLRDGPNDSSPQGSPEIQRLDRSKMGALVEHLKDALHHAQKAKIAFQNHPNNLWWWNQYLVHRVKIEEIYWTLAAFGESVFFSNLEQRFEDFVINELNERLQTRSLNDRFSAARILEALTNIYLLFKDTKRDESDPISALAKAWGSEPSKSTLKAWGNQMLELIRQPKTKAEEEANVSAFCKEIDKWQSEEGEKDGKKVKLRDWINDKL